VNLTVTRADPATTFTEEASTMVSSDAAAAAVGSTRSGATPGRRDPIVMVTRNEGTIEISPPEWHAKRVASGRLFGEGDERAQLCHAGHALRQAFAQFWGEHEV
jgi:hypothetical protein